jgi:drug/metabolite transporter (DMT)-like permease
MREKIGALAPVWRAASRLHDPRSQAIYPPGVANGHEERVRPRPATLAAFLAMVAMAGGNAVAIRYISCAECELEPFWSAAMRFLLAAGIFVAIALALRVRVPRGRALSGALLYGVLQFGGGFGFVYWGFVRAPAGLGQVLLACVPLLTFGFALAQRQERFRWEGLVGATVAVSGIAAVFGSGIGAGVPLTSMLAILAGAVCWSEALIAVKGFPPVHPAAMNAIGMLVGSAILFALSVIQDEARVLPVGSSTLAAQAYLVLAGSIGVFWLYVFVLSRWTASAASYQLVLIPLVTVAVSAWLLDERITWTFAAGSVLVLIGVYVGVLRRPAHRAPLSTTMAPAASRRG